MMQHTKRWQNRVTTGRSTLPVAIVIAVACWLLGTTTWSQHAWLPASIGLLGYGLMGYFLILLNNAYAIIRMRASMQTAFFFLFVATCPFIYTLYEGEVAAAAFLGTLFFLFRGYQSVAPEADLFYAFACLGLGSLWIPWLLWMVPWLWIGAYNFRALSLRSFMASCVGLAFPYWCGVGYVVWSGDATFYTRILAELTTFQPLCSGFAGWEIATLVYLLILYVVSTAHCLLVGYEDKMRTRSYLHFLILVTLYIFLAIGLQPIWGVKLLPLLFMLVSMLAGHLFVLTHSRSSNLFFIATWVGLLLLYIGNVWKN